MIDTSRIKPLLDAMKQVDDLLKKWQAPLMPEEREELLHAHSLSWHTIMDIMPIQKICASCAFCTEWEGKTCCAIRNMVPIPFEVVNRVGGCSKWDDKDFIPF